jgi:hypothetical protein
MGIDLKMKLIANKSRFSKKMILIRFLKGINRLNYIDIDTLFTCGPRIKSKTITYSAGYEKKKKKKTANTN